MRAGGPFDHAGRLHRGQEHLSWTAQRGAGSKGSERAERKTGRSERKRWRGRHDAEFTRLPALGKRSGRKYIREMPLPAKLGQPPRSVLWVDD